jgi:hypothetical protein
MPMWPGMTAKTLLALLAAAVATIALAAPASARVPDDPCHGDGFSLQRLDERLQRSCYSAFEVPPHTTMIDENRIRNGTFGCPDGWQIPDPNNEGLSGIGFNGNWDFWAYRGEWVTWMGGGIVSAAGRGSNRMEWYLPDYHNWGSWSWPVRTFTECEPMPGTKVARAAQDDSADVVGPSKDDDTRATGRGDDQAFGGRGDDTLSGGRGDDTLLGGRDDDTLIGGRGGDELFDDQGRDVLRGGPGNDRFSTRDGHRDSFHCGPGEDVAIADTRDTFSGCEHVYRSAAEDPAQPPDIG